MCPYNFPYFTESRILLCGFKAIDELNRRIVNLVILYQWGDWFLKSLGL